MATAWVSGPERGLSFVKKEAVMPSGNEEATFEPQLVSNASLRDKVISSSYGKVVPQVKLTIDSNTTAPPWEEPSTFTPELVNTLTATELRAHAQSSSYGSTPVKVRSLSLSISPQTLVGRDNS